MNQTLKYPHLKIDARSSNLSFMSYWLMNERFTHAYGSSVVVNFNCTVNIIGISTAALSELWTV